MRTVDGVIIKINILKVLFPDIKSPSCEIIGLTALPFPQFSQTDMFFT